MPEEARGVVLFAHGSGSGRHSPRNRYVAEKLQRIGLATLLIDLLTSEEEEEDLRTGQLRFDIGLLAERLVGATDWLKQNPNTRQLRIGHFGASTGGGGAGRSGTAAGERRGASLGWRKPDLAGQDNLSRVQGSTLLIVGGQDEPVIGMNRQAMEHLRSEKRMEIVPGAMHLFEEPGALEEVARLAADWFLRHLDLPPE